MAGTLTAVVTALILLGGGARLWWRPSRLDRGPVAQANAAYSRGDWDRSALLARRRLKEVPDDAEALRL
ncbi:MAG TPA: hypothetical protein VFF52_13875, partial [Isosphaeraceae bacterium]|nr:hypothetical protein [Isosphaeraceae bacterium]